MPGVRCVAHRLECWAAGDAARSHDGDRGVRFDYVGGVMPEERPTIERFEQDVLPFIEKHGGRIGEAAMMGDEDATEVINRYRLFVEGMAHLRAHNLKLLIRALKRCEAKGRQ